MDSNYTCGNLSMMYRLVEPLCCTLDTNVTVCINCTKVKNYYYKEMFAERPNIKSD